MKKILFTASLTIWLLLFSITAFAFQQNVVIEATAEAETKVVTFPSTLSTAVIQVDSNFDVGKVVTIEQQDTDKTWASIVINDTVLSLSSVNTQIMVFGINRIRISKPSSTSVTGISVLSDGKIK